MGKKSEKKAKGTKAKTEKVDLRKLPREKRPEPTSGQHGKPIDIDYDRLNVHEQRTVRALEAAGNAMSIPEIAKACSKLVHKPVTTLQVRNAMRRLVRGSWVDSKSRGVYRLTSRGRAKFTSAKDGKPSAAKAKEDDSKDGPKAPKKERAAKAAKAEVLSPAYAGKVPSKYEKGTNEYKSAMIIEALKDIGAFSDSKVAKLTGLTRGFVIPRVKRLRTVGTTGLFGTAFDELVVISEGKKPCMDPEIVNGETDQPATPAETTETA
jgi:DNA-binding PadR family transcriptional regulator